MPIDGIGVGGLFRFLKQGLIALMIIIVIAELISSWLTGNVEIDSCLDSSGRYNYENQICEYKQ